MRLLEVLVHTHTYPDATGAHVLELPRRGL
jgi:hypothetical protein